MHITVFCFFFFYINLIFLFLSFFRNIFKEKEVTKVDKERNENIITISYKIKFINRARFMARSLSNLADNLLEGIRKIKWKDYDCFFEHESASDNLIN